MKNSFLLFLVLLGLVCLDGQVWAQGTPKISIQGILRDANGGAVQDGRYEVTFDLYDTVDGDNSVWTEVDSVDVVNGIYSHQLGSVQTLDAGDFTSARFLGVRVGDVTLPLRRELPYSPYAFAVNEAQYAPVSESAGISNQIRFLPEEESFHRLLIDSTQNKLFLYIDDTERFSIDAEGRVGVGGAGALFDLCIGDNDTGIDHRGDGNFALSTDGFGRIYLRPDGRVGISTNDPRAPLHVAGGGTSASINGNYFKHDFPLSTFPQIGYYTRDITGVGGIVAFFDGDVVAREGIISSGSVNWSDARTKLVLGRSEATADLQLLNDLRITDYEMIDHFSDPTTYKKVIAQEVEEVFPQAVRTSRKAIPNIYAPAISTHYEAGQVWITLAKAHQLVVGDHVELFTPEAGRLMEVEVQTVVDAITFAVAIEAAPSEVFVYGKYVDDFKAVDYDALAMLNISANQALVAELAALEAESELLQTKQADLRAAQAVQLTRLQSLEAQLLPSAAKLPNRQ
ncbi:MAG: tail fiber domain-containing protein [Bacteroidetes bacterium]|nr:MAG: tail fiber domain-containing protein [Bacteroidota bacterium]